MNVIERAKEVIELEKEALNNLEKELDENFEKAVDLIFSSKGRVVVAGIGKSGIIGRKISSTLSSTGTPSFFLHPGEAIHGDLGMITKEDIILAISNSGETEEVLKIIFPIKEIGAKIISITSQPSSHLGSQSDIILKIGENKEADPFGLIPTSSIIAILALGDALSICLLQKRGFQKKDFALFHPGGELGKRLLLRVKDIMRTGKEIPILSLESSLSEILKEVTEKGFGFTLVVDEIKKVIGIITDGDIRRVLLTHSNFQNLKAKEIMSLNPQNIKEEDLAAKALQKMEEKAITSLVISDKDGKPKGIVHLHDLLGRKELRFEI